jgi:hypothetical protein
MLGMTVNEDIDGWVVIGAEPGQRQLAFCARVYAFAARMQGQPNGTCLTGPDMRSRRWQMVSCPGRSADPAS